MGVETLVEASRLLRDEGHRLSRADWWRRVAACRTWKTSFRERDSKKMFHCSGVWTRKICPRRMPPATASYLPTRALECFGLIVLEAFAAGTPVIASRVAAIPELAACQGDEWMFAPGNAQELADRMRRFLQGDLTTRINLRETACEYDRPLVVRQWKELLRPEGVVTR